MAKVEAVKAPDMQEWEVKDAAETILKAEEIKANKELMAKVHKLLDKKHKAIKSVRDLRDASNKMAMEEEDESEEA